MDLSMITRLMIPLVFSLVLTRGGKLRFSAPVVFALSFAVQEMVIIGLWPWLRQLPYQDLIWPPLLFVAVWFLLRESPKRRLIFWAGSMVFLGLSFLLCAVVGRSIFGLSAAEVLEASSGQGALVCLTLLPDAFMVFGCLFSARLEKMESMIFRRVLLVQFLLFLSQVLCVMILCWNMGSKLLDVWTPRAVLSSLLAVLAQFACYETIHTSVSAVREKMELEHVCLMNEMNRKCIRMAQENAKEMEMLCSQFRKELQEARGLLEQRPTQAAACMERIEQQLEAARPPRYCADPVVNTILAIKGKDAAAAGIRFEARAAVCDWKIEESDLSSLFLNLMDNAIEGCLRSGKKDPSISVKAGCRSGFYVVSVSNDCHPSLQEETHFVTSKGDSALHGWGLRIIGSIAGKYGGTLQVQVTDGQFIAKVVLSGQSPPDDRDVLLPFLRPRELPDST